MLPRVKNTDEINHPANDAELRRNEVAQAIALPGHPLDYLRFVGGRNFSRNLACFPASYNLGWAKRSLK